MKRIDKTERQALIREILVKNEIASQEEVMQRLLENGYEITQATLSRDFREMKVAKTPDAAGNYFYRLPTVGLLPDCPEKYGTTSPFSRCGIINIEF